MASSTHYLGVDLDHHIYLGTRKEDFESVIAQEVRRSG